MFFLFTIYLPPKAIPRIYELRNLLQGASYKAQVTRRKLQGASGERTVLYCASYTDTITLTYSAVQRVCTHVYITIHNKL
jgi:hypothetical protein